MKNVRITGKRLRNLSLAIWMAVGMGLPVSAQSTVNNAPSNFSPLTIEEGALLTQSLVEAAVADEAKLQELEASYRSLPDELRATIDNIIRETKKVRQLRDNRAVCEDCVDVVTTSDGAPLGAGGCRQRICVTCVAAAYASVLAVAEAHVCATASCFVRCGGCSAACSATFCAYAYSVAFAEAFAFAFVTVCVG